MGVHGGMKKGDSGCKVWVVDDSVGIGWDGGREWQVQSPEACDGGAWSGEGDFAIVFDGDGTGSEVGRVSMVTELTDGDEGAGC